MVHMELFSLVYRAQSTPPANTRCSVAQEHMMYINVMCLHQPQNSMPDVIIWMLRGEKRVAFARVPAKQILYSSFSEQACGKHCGLTQTIFMQVQD